MAAVKIGLDLDTRKFLNADGGTLQGITWKKGTVVDYQLTIFQNEIGVSLPEGSTVKIAIKKVTDPAGTYLFDTDANPSGWGSGSKWFFRLDLTGTSFDDPALFNKAQDFEAQITFPDGQRIASLTIGFTLAKNVIT